MPDRLVAHATRKEQLIEVGLDPIGIARSVRDAVSRTKAAVAAAAAAHGPLT
jgi:1-deoxy-D-xylulose-5-phosphate synthase